MTIIQRWIEHFVAQFRMERAIIRNKEYAPPFLGTSGDHEL